MLSTEQKDGINATIASNNSQVTQLTLINAGLQAALDKDTEDQTTIDAAVASGVQTKLDAAKAALS